MNPSDRRDVAPQVPVPVPIQEEEQHEHSDPEKRRPARSEVDDSAKGDGEAHSGPRGGFASEQDAAIPGGTTGEHSGQQDEKGKA